jgi:catechol 2,3-dioxygenase-like lactoylglutathione lyase family enzyme
MPTLTGILESSLYVADLDRARRFYETVLGLTALHSDERFCALEVAGRQVLLLFRQGASLQASKIPGGIIPPHDGRGQLHLALAIAADQWDRWLDRLDAAGVAIESIVNWERGGRSIYFRDPDGHAIELITPGCWKIY